MKKPLFALIFCISFTYSIAQDLLSQKKPERLYKSGVDLLERREFGAALQCFDEFIKLSPEDLRTVDAGYYRALCGLYLYHLNAEKDMADFMEAHPLDPHAARAHYDMGNFYYTEKNYTKAAGAYEQVDFSMLSSDQQNAGRFRFGYSLFNQKKLKEALDQFNYIKTGGGQYGPASSYYAGFMEYGLGDFDGALIDLLRAEQNPSYSRVVPYLIANVHYKRKDYDQLLKYSATLKEKEGLSNPEEIALLSAEAQFKKSDYKSALNGYQQYLTGKNNADRGVLFRAGYAAFSIGQDKTAVEYFKSSASDKDSVGFYSSYYLGSLYLKQQQKPLALTAFDNSRKFKTDARLAEESTYQFAKICYDLGRSDQAISEFEKFLTGFPRSSYNGEVKELLSVAYVNANNYNKAIEYIESLSSRSPAIERAYQKASYLKGTELFNKEDYAQAVAFFERSLRTPVDMSYVAEASFWCGEAYSIGKKYTQAIPNYEGTLTVAQYANPYLLSKTRYGLGYAYYNLQRYDRALINFREFARTSATTNSSYADGILRLADCYYVTKAYSDAVNYYKRAIQLNSPDADYAHLQLGVIYGIQGKYGDAAIELDQVIKNNPASRYLDEAMFDRAQFYFEQGNYAAAVTEFSKIISTNKPSRFLPYAYQRRAASYYNQKDYNKTAGDYIAVLENFPTHPITAGVLLPLQESLSLSNRSGEFDKYLAQFKASNPDAKGMEAVEFEAAKNLYFNQDYQRAISSLANYASTYPGSPRTAEANFYRAESLYRLKDFDGALKVYSEINVDGAFTFTNKVVNRMAELEFKRGSFEKAVPHFQRLANRATTKKDQSIAWTGLMESYFQLARYDSADAYARLILEKGKVNAGAENKAMLFLGKSAMGRGDYESAKDEFLSTLNSARDEYGAEAKYLLGELFYLSKDYKGCYETLVSLNKDFAEYTDWVGKSYLLMADNYSAMGEMFQAKGTLKSLIDNFPSQAVKDQARERLKKLDDEDLKKQRQEEQDTIDNKKN
jgi:tetratricopeptide (TPR) repeat protein